MRHLLQLTLWFLIALTTSQAAFADISQERPPKGTMENGKAGFLANCVACHQSDGKGMKGVFPPLAGSDFLKPPYTEAIDVVINGKSGRLMVNGVEYNNLMPAMSHLTDDDIADILSWIVNSWGNPGGTITAGQVKQVRGTDVAKRDPAQGQTHPDTSQAEMKYKGAPSVLESAQAKIVRSPGAPDLTNKEFEVAKQIFFERCAGCHGVLRKGATGKPLTPDITRVKGTDYLKALINYGSPAGMPNWGTSNELSAKEIDIMARYLQHEPPEPPEFGMPEMKGTWKVHVPVNERPKKPMHSLNIENFFKKTFLVVPGLFIIFIS